ncbi:hypothetical protein CU044_1041 [Streptomyces sp. L-9-10]|nr:hypothetical protein CU044_1041 [Streptomyces sp. L-9-10]
MAHRIAGIAAVQAHRDLAVDRSGYVPVHAALRTAGLDAMARPMPRLFGVYFSPHDEGPAVLLNSGLDVITQRHTAAHELGHHCQGDSSSYDQELDPSARWGNGSWPEEEKIAEAFAAWFLMPRPAVLGALQRIAGGRPGHPEHAYLVARALGTSYAGTVRHLARLSQLGRSQAEQWLKIPPAALKRSLTGGADVGARPHVHVVTAETHGQRLHVDVGDVLVLHLPGARFCPLPKTLASWPHSPLGTHRAVEVTDDLGSECLVNVDVPDSVRPLQLTLARESPRHGIHDVWP